MKKIRTKPVKLIELIRTLDRKEFNGFGRYVNSMVKDKNIYKLFLELKKYAPHFEIGQKEREKIFSKIFANKKYNNRELNYLTSAMNLHLEEYLIMIAIRQNQKQKDYMLMEYYRSRKQFDFFKRTAESIMEKEEEKLVKDGEYYLTRMKIEYDLYHYIENDNKRVERQSKRIESMVNSLDEFYMYYKLNLASDLTAFGQAFNVEKNIYLFIEEIKSVVKQRSIHNNTLIQIYLFIIEHFKEHNSENYFNLKEKVFSVIDLLNDKDQRTLFSCLSNYLIICLRKGIPNLRYELFFLQKTGIDKGYTIKNNELNYQNFLNAITIATEVNINEIKWAKELLKNKSHLIRKDIKDDCVELAKGYISYAEQNYNDVIDNLNEIKQWRQYSFGLQARLLMLKSYYELDLITNGGYIGLAEYLADSYRNYLRRHKIFSESITRSVINFINFTMKIMKNRYSKKYSIEELLENLDELGTVASREWLIEKINTHRNRKRLPK